MNSSTLNTLASLTPLNLDGLFMNTASFKESIVSLNKFTKNVNRQGISFFDKPDSYVALLNVAGFDKSEIKITEEKSLSGYSLVNVNCKNDQFAIDYVFNLPSSANLNSIKSSLKNGMLTISCEIKTQKSKLISIEVL